MLSSSIDRFGRPRRVAGLVVAAIVALGAAGCGSSDPSGKTAAKTTSGHCSSYTKMKVGYVPSMSDVSLLVGAQLGVFKAKCLDVTPTLVSQPPNSYPELLSGQLDALDGSALITATYVSNGAPINIVGGEEVESTTLGNNSKNWWQIVTLKSNKSVNSLDDLIGKSVAVAQLNSFTELAVENYFMREGKSPKSIKWVVMPQANQMAALQHGEVQAVYAGEPYLTQAAQSAPMKTVYSGSPVANTPIGAYVMTKRYEAAHPAAFKAFQQAVPLAYAAVQSHEALARQLIKKSLSLNDATANAVHFPNYVDEFPAGALQAALQLESKLGWIKSVPPNSKLLALPAS